MVRLIDADVIPEVSADPYEEAGFRSVLDEQPTVDAVPVIRCKDCRWWVKDKRMGNIGRCFGREHQWAMHSDGFCSDAERRTDEID